MLVNSEDTRIAKRVVLEQERRGIEKCWFDEMKREAEEVEIEVSEAKVKDIKKSTWKKNVKEKVRKAFEKMCKNKINTMKKLQFLGKCRGRYTYVKETFNNTTRMAMFIRLNMMEMVTTNYGRNEQCVICNVSRDTTEHVFECKNTDVSIEDLKNATNMDKVVELFRKVEEEKREILINNIIMNII